MPKVDAPTFIKIIPKEFQGRQTSSQLFCRLISPLINQGALRRIFGKREWLCKENLLIKRPVIELDNGDVIVGYDEELYNEVFGGENR